MDVSPFFVDVPDQLSADLYILIGVLVLLMGFYILASLIFFFLNCGCLI